MSLTPRLRRDGDDPHRSTPWLVARQLTECATDLAQAGRITDIRQFPQVALHMLGYHAAFAGLPLASRRLTRLGAMVNGRRLRLSIRANPSDLHVYREIFLHGALRDLVGTGLSEARTVVDLGSNIGLATMYLACWATGARFYCADPAPENNAVARRSAGENGVDAVIETVAVADHDGSVEFYPNEWWASSSTVRSIMDSRTGRRERFESAMTLPAVGVPATTVDSFLARHGLTHVDLMKIDIEGAEAEVLRADTGWLDRVQTVAIEIHRKYVDPGPVLDAFARHGMRRLPSTGPLDVFTH